MDLGGDPREIPNLTYTQFKAFHERYYHPSNAYIYFYGDDDPEQRLRLMAEYLGAFEPIQVELAIALQSRFEEPRRLTIPFDPGAGPDRRVKVCCRLTGYWAKTETRCACWGCRYWRIF